MEFNPRRIFLISRLPLDITQFNHPPQTPSIHIVRVWGVQITWLSIVFSLHEHLQKLIGSLGGKTTFIIHNMQTIFSEGACYRNDNGYGNSACSTAAGEAWGGPWNSRIAGGLIRRVVFLGWWWGCCVFLQGTETKPWTDHYRHPSMSVWLGYIN